MREGLRYGQRRIDHPNGDTEVSGQCTLKPHTHTVVVSRAELNAWLDGEGLIQVCMPSLAREEREFLISGSCPKCFDEFFRPGAAAEDEDDDGYDPEREN